MNFARAGRPRSPRASCPPSPMKEPCHGNSRPCPRQFRDAAASSTSRRTRADGMYRGCQRRNPLRSLRRWPRRRQLCDDTVRAPRAGQSLRGLYSARLMRPTTPMPSAHCMSGSITSNTTIRGNLSLLKCRQSLRDAALAAPKASQPVRLAFGRKSSHIILKCKPWQIRAD